jgi:hypothetical protein
MNASEQITMLVMRLTIRHWNGIQDDGVLLTERDLIMRVAVFGCDDAIEFRFRRGHWFAENGDLVQVEFHPTCLDVEGNCASGGSVFNLTRHDLCSWLN